MFLANPIQHLQLEMQQFAIKINSLVELSWCQCIDLMAMRKEALYCEGEFSSYLHL